MMRRKNNRRIIILIAVLFLCGLFVFDHFVMTPMENNPTADAVSQKTELIANNTSDSGYVHVIKNVGNPNAKKIAYVVGVHPLENDTHRTLLKLLPAMDNLNYCYDIYIINVTEDFNSYGQLLPDDNPGRDTGQNLAYKYVYPEIMKGNYEMAVDIHAHGGAYPYDTFVFSPVKNSTGADYAMNVSKSTENVSYYDPEHTTSGPYLTVPLNQNGVPAFYFEENSFNPQDLKDAHMKELIHGIDNLKF